MKINVNNESQKQIYHKVQDQLSFNCTYAEEQHHLLLTSLLPPQLGVLRPQVPDLVLVRTERAKVRDITDHLELHLILP